MPAPDQGRNTSLLRSARLQRHWSQRELAERVGATLATVKRWERQTTVPGPYFRLKLTALFGKSEEELGLKEAPSALLAPPSASEAPGEEQALPISPAVPSLWTVPYRRNPYFTGRDELFRLLDEHLAVAELNEHTPTRRVALTQAQALTGLGGIGKTQVAIEYAYRTHEQGTYTHTFWINAASEEAILTSFTSFAALLPASAATNETDQQKLVNALKRWLEECRERWLLIFDNADDLATIQHYFPRYGNGSILLTTRVHAVGSLATAIEVQKMSLAEAIGLLRRRAQRLNQAIDNEMHVVKNLVAALDCFPLALEQAASYIEETGCSFDAYLQLYQTHRSTLLARRGAQATNYPDSVATTWSLSFQQVEQANPAAIQLLHLCAFLAPDSIPEELLREGATYWPPLLQQAVTDQFTYNQLLEALLRFSLVKRLTEDRLLSIHRLVQVVQAEMIDPEEQRRWAERIVCAVNDLFPRQPGNDVSSSRQCQRYLEQVLACATLIEQQQVQLSEATDVLDRAGTYLWRHASYSLAETLYQQALHLREQRLGPHHPEIATSLHNFGLLYYQQGKYQLAVQHYQQALHIREEQLGAHHSETARTLNNLGLVFHEQGRYQPAEQYYQRAAATLEEQLGTQHPSLIAPLENLGLLYTEQGRYQLAESSLKRALATGEEKLGVNHSKTAEVLLHLSILYIEQGQYELAESYGQRALAILEEQLGTQHPSTGRVLENLGLLSYEQGRYQLAEQYYQRALAILEEQLGTQHPETARTSSYLAELYREQHKYEQAEFLFTRALAIQENTIVGNHPDLATTLQNFACFHEDLGNLQTAATLYQRALAIREQVYGLDHPKTCATHESLQRVLHLLEPEDKEVQKNAKHLEQVEMQEN